MDNDDGIVLNLASYEYQPKKFTQKKKNQVGTQPNKTKSDENGIVNTKRQGSVNDDKNRNNYHKTNTNNNNQKKYIDPKDFVPISNLFNKNPEIPSLPTLPVSDKKHEDLFSSDNIDDLQVGDKLKSNLKNHSNLTTLTTIQKLALPLLLQGKDVMIKSPTGSGKTFCYSIPIVDKLSKLDPPVSRMNGPYVLVLVPTRELALQTLGVFQALVKCCISIVPGMLIGGEKCKSEKARLRKGVNVLIATPGRLIYHMKETSCLDLSHIEFLILDEADHLLDMGFREKIVEIIKLVDNNNNCKRQSVLLSATLNENVKDLISVSLKDPVFVDSADVDKITAAAASNEHEYVAPSSLTQHFVTVPAKLRLVTLITFTMSKVATTKKGKVMIFTSSKNSVIFLSHAFKVSKQEYFASSDHVTFSLHGDMSQQQRFEAFDKFKRCESGILFCTDVASRGLDIKKVDWVLQYECPTQTDDYLHRIGRTARIGETGNSVLFLLPSEVEYINVLHKSSVVLTEIKISDILKKFAESKRTKVIEEKAQSLQNKIEESISSSEELNQKAVQAYKSFIQSYTTYPKELKEIFHLKLLHLGHIAKSFGLRKAPSNAISSAQMKTGRKRQSDHFKKDNKTTKRVKVDELGEVSCGPRTKKEVVMAQKKKKPKIRV